MKTTTFRTQYRKFRMLTARFFSYWFFVIFATLGVAIAVMERFTNVLGIRVLKTETGVNRDGIEHLREEFRTSERVGNSAPAA